MSVLNALVHRSVTEGARAHHARFAAIHLGIAFAALAVVPLFLAFRGAPDLSDTLVLACAFTPLASACVVLRSGRLDAGRAVNIIGLIGLASILWFQLGAGLGCAVAWLAAAQIAAIGHRRLQAMTALVAAAVLLTMATMPVAGTARSEAVDALFSALALAYATIGALALSTRDVETAVALRDDQAPVAQASDWAWADFATLSGGSILVLDERGSLLALHGDAESSRGFDTRHVLARGFFEHVHVADRPAFLKLVADAAHGAPCAPAQIRLRSWAADLAQQSPTHRRLEIRALSGSVGGAVIAHIRDIDDATDDSGRLSELNHDMRSPLNAIIGFSEMLSSRTLRPADVEKQYEYARIVHKAGQNLLGLIDTMMGDPKPSTLPVMPLATSTTIEAVPGRSPQTRMKKRA